MCSIGEEDFGDEGATHSMIPDSSAVGITISAGNCNKCGLKSDAIYKLKFRVPECRECFLNYARHKFRAALGASKVLPRNAEVLLVIDGSAESLVLLDMLHYGQTQNNFKRMHCNARVFWIDDRSIHDNLVDLGSLHELYKRYETFDFYCTEMGDMPENLQKLSNYTRKATIEDNELFLRLNKLRSLTARQDYVQQERKRLIAKVARKLNCAFIFEPSISTTLASQLLTAIALGRGGSAACDVALQDDRLSGGIKLLRPLKDLTDDEVQFYIHAQQLIPFRLSSHVYGHEQGQTASLQNLTNAFMKNLQQNYASTVSTVFRTGDKIAVNRQLEPSLAQLQIEEAATPTICAYCRSPLDIAESDTLLAIEYSRAVSEAGVTSQKCEDTLENIAKLRLATADSFCHACRNMQAELDGGTLI